MKKVLLPLLFFFSAFTLSAQQLYFEVFTGGNLTAYNDDFLGEEQWYVPIGVRVGGGLEHFQLGAEYKQNITNAQFDTESTRFQFQEKYYGAFLRANLSVAPAYRVGLIFKGGAGYYDIKQQIYQLPTEGLIATVKTDPVLGFNGGIGISAPIHTFVHSEFSYQYNYVKDGEIGDIGVGQLSYHSFQFGLSINLVFGRTAMRCHKFKKRRRKGDHKGWQNF